MKVRSLVRRALAAPLRLMPEVLRHRAAQLLITASSRRAPAAALRSLLSLADDVDAAVDQAAMRYGDGVHVKHRLMRYHDFFVDRVGGNASVIDIGCGYGAVAYSIAERTSATVVGIDLDAANIAMARGRFAHPRLTFIHGDALQELPGRRFEVIVLSNVLEHIERRVDFLRALRTLGPTILLIRVPMFDRHWRVPLRKELGMVYVSDPTHYTEYTREAFESEMDAAGLDIGHLQVNWGEIWAEVRPRGEHTA